MNKKDIQHFKNKLLEEKKDLEEELNEIAQKKDPGQNWEATSGSMIIDPADDNEVADKFEEYEGNKGVMEKLQKQLSDVDVALEKIEKGEYGICEVCGKPIEQDRLEANPSAKESIKHNH